MQDDKLLRNTKTGRLFRYSSILAKRADMELVKLEKAVSATIAASAKEIDTGFTIVADKIALADAVQVIEARMPAGSDESVTSDSAVAPGDSDNSEDFVVSTATKGQLAAFALAEFNVKLDKRKALVDLRAEVMELAGATD